MYLEPLQDRNVAPCNSTRRVLCQHSEANTVKARVLCQNSEENIVKALVLCQHSEANTVKALVSTKCPEDASKLGSFREELCLAPQKRRFEGLAD